MGREQLKRGDIDPQTGKVFVQWTRAKNGKRYPYLVTPERFREIKRQNKAAAKLVYYRDPKKRIRKVREWQARQNLPFDQ